MSNSLVVRNPRVATNPFAASNPLVGRIGDPNFIILYVRDASESAALYADLFGKQPIMSTAEFCAFHLDSGVTFGLWTRSDVEPAPATHGGGSEICFPVADDAAVRATHKAWSWNGLKIVQEPTEMDFGLTFVALDSDGHRLRVYAPRMS